MSFGCFQKPALNTSHGHQTSLAADRVPLPLHGATGATRATAKRLAEHLGVDETQAIHLALHELAAKVLPQYEADRWAADGDSIEANQKARAPGRQAFGQNQSLWYRGRMIWWEHPTAGENGCCHFPDYIRPRPKPRPALV